MTTEQESVEPLVRSQTGATTEGHGEERPLAVHRLEFRAGYRDVDSMGIVYYGVYADWFTRGRIELMRSVGVRYADWERQGLFLPVLRLECRYRSSIALDDPVRLQTELTACTRTRMAFRYRVYRAGEDGRPDLLCALGVTEHAYIDERRRPVDIRKRFPHVWKALAPVAEGAGESGI